MSKNLFWVSCLAATLGGCVVTPAPMAYRQPAPVYIDHGVPPIEYVEGGVPVYYDNEPGVPFYPIFLDTPGSCFCIVPMRYVGGVWLGVGGAVLYRGHFPFHHAPPQHRDIWIRSGGIMGGHHPIPGRIEREGNVMRALPPPGSVHAHDAARPNPGMPPRQQPPAATRETPAPQQPAQGMPFRQQQGQPAGQARPAEMPGQPAAARPQGMPQQQQAAPNAHRENDRRSEHKCSREDRQARRC